MMRYGEMMTCAPNVRYGIPRLTTKTSSTGDETRNNNNNNNNNNTVTFLVEDERFAVISVESQKLLPPPGVECGRIWKTKGTSDAVLCVSYVLEDIIGECGLCGRLSLSETGTFELKSNLVWIRLAGLPVGVVNVVGHLDDEYGVGELYDQLLHLHSLYGAQQAIGILTTYHEWRVCWLDNEETNAFCEKDVVIHADSDRAIPSFSKKKKEKKTSSDFHGLGMVEEELRHHHQATFILKHRKMRSSRIWHCKNENVFPLVASALLKMNQVTFQGFDHPFDRLSERFLPCLDDVSFHWARLDDIGTGKWDYVPNPNTKNLYLLEDLGVGAKGHVWLASSARGAICVIKFIANQFDLDKSHRMLQEECNWWHTVYPEFSHLVRIAKFCERPALVMPHFDTPAYNVDTLALVEKTLRESFGRNGFEHPDVRWANIGIYKDGNNEVKAIVYDLDGIENCHSSQNGWIDAAVTRLRQGLMVTL